VVSHTPTGALGGEEAGSARAPEAARASPLVRTTNPSGEKAVRMSNSLLAAKIPRAEAVCFRVKKIVNAR
jgi:hypothetical protein